MTMIENMSPQMAALLNEMIGVTGGIDPDRIKTVQFEVQHRGRKRKKLRQTLNRISTAFQKVPNMGLSVTFTEDKGFWSSTFYITFRGTVQMINALNKALKDSQR